MRTRGARGPAEPFAARSRLAARATVCARTKRQATRASISAMPAFTQINRIG